MLDFVSKLSFKIDDNSFVLFSLLLKTLSDLISQSAVTVYLRSLKLFFKSGALVLQLEVGLVDLQSLLDFFF